MITVRDKVTSKTKDGLQKDMDNLFYELTGKQNKPKVSWYNNASYKGRKYGKGKFSK